jgi:2'-5' RNA ligase
VALELPPEWREALAVEGRALEAAAPGFGRWVGPALMHITLAFLGGQDPDLVPEIERAVDRAAAASAPFSLRLASPGSFGGRRSLRVIWVGVEDRPGGSLARLHTSVAAQLETAKIGFDPAPFRAHITLGRARRDATSEQSDAMYNAIARRVAQSAKGLRAGPTRLDEVTLMRSDLRATGPTYTPLHRTALG